jgi:hypothetical protein
MFRSIIYRLLARIVYHPSQQSLVLRVPIEDFKDVALRSWTIQKGYLVVEMTGEPVQKPLDEFNCRRC